MQTTDPGAMTIPETMAALRIGSKQTIYRLIHDGTLETYRIGNRRYTSAAQRTRCVERLSEQTSREVA